MTAMIATAAWASSGSRHNSWSGGNNAMASAPWAACFAASGCQPAMITFGGRTAGHRCRKVSVDTVLTRTQAAVPAKTSNILDCAKSKRSALVLGYPRTIIA